MSMRAQIAALTVLLAADGCATLPTGQFGEQAFAAPKSAYSIPYADAGARDLLPGWRVDNFIYVKGKPDETKKVATLTSNLSWEQADGTEITVRALTYDLKLTHRESDAFIWMRALPKPAESRTTRLDVLAEGWANGAGGNFFSWGFRGPRAKRFTTKIVGSDETELDGLPAYRVVFDVVDLDQRELDKDAPRQRVVGIFVGPAVKKTLEWNSTFFDVPGCLFFGYANSADEFDDLLPEFEGLLKRVHVTGVTAPRRP